MGKIQPGKMKKGKAVRYMLPGFLLVCLAGIAAYADTARLTISQMTQDGGDVLLYVSGMDDDDRPVLDGSALNPESLVIRSDSEAYQPVSVEPWKQDGQSMTLLFCADLIPAGGRADPDLARQVLALLRDAADPRENEAYKNVLIGGWELPLSDEQMTETDADFSEAVDTLEEQLTEGGGEDSEENSAEDGLPGETLWKCLEAALRTWNEEGESGARAAVIAFTAGGSGDDRDDVGTDLYELRLQSARTRIPVYVIALDESSPEAAFTEAGRFARQSGGLMVMESDAGLQEAYDRIREVIDQAYRVRIEPADEEFGKKNVSWKASFAGEEAASGAGYVFSLEKPEQDEDETKDASGGKQTEVITEAAFGAEQTGQAGKTAAAETGRRGFAGKMNAFLSENLFIVIAAFMMLLAIIILIVVIVRGKKKKGNGKRIQEYDDPSYSSFAPGGTIPVSSSLGRQDRPAASSSLEKTIDEYAYNPDSEKTVDEYSMMDNEKTVDGSLSRGIRLAFSVSFCGRTQTIERTIVDKLIVGRGEKSDVDVVLGLRNDQAKQTSREHVIITNRIDGLFVRDNESRNGTVLNGRELNGEMPLRNEDILQMGKSIVQIRIDQSSI